MKHILLSVITGLFLATAYLIDAHAWAGNATNKDTAVDNADQKQVAVVVPTEAEFMKVITAKCVRCHKKPCASVEALKLAKWVIPGRPEHSSAYTIIGKNAKPKGTYHNLTDDEKNTVKEFIKNLK
jgi:uncharacterized membrane protein